MNSTVKIATWNLERPWKNGRRIRAGLQIEQIRSVGADIWVLTETWDRIKIPGYRCVSTPSSLGPYDASESAVAIWVPEAWDLRSLEVTTTTLCAEVLRSPGDMPLLVYGTIITWHGAPGAKNWVKHLAEVDRQTADWVRLRGEYPDHLLVVAGDFNMTLSTDKGYGHPEGRRQVRERLAAAGMTCLTEFDIRDPSRGGLDRDNIDHICVDQRFQTAESPRAFAGSNAEGQRLSDHNGMLVEVSTSSSQEQRKYSRGEKE